MERQSNQKPAIEPHLKIKSSSKAARCEICHQADQFDPENDVCARCQNIALDYPGKEQVERLTNNLAHNRQAALRETNHPALNSITYAIGFLLGLLFYLPLHIARRHHLYRRLFISSLKNFFLITHRNHRGEIVTGVNRIAVSAVIGAIGLPISLLYLAYAQHSLHELDILIVIGSVLMGFILGALIGAATEE